MKRCLFLLFFFLTPLGWAQEARKEALKSALSKADNTKQKINLLLELAGLEDFDGNLSCKKRALKLTEINGLTPETEIVTNRISNLLDNSLKFREKIAFCLPYYKKFNHPQFNYGRTNMAFHLGFSYENLGKTDSMFYYYAKVIEQANERSARERRIKSRTLRNRGYIYLGQSEYMKAIHDLEQSLELLDEKDHNNEAAIRLALFNLYHDLKDRKKAISELNLAAKAAKKAGGFIMLANTEYFYATWYLKDNPQKALQHGLNGLRIYEKNNHLPGILFMKNILAKVYFELHDFQEAEKTNHDILRHAQALGVNENAAIAQKNLGQIALTQKNYPAALNYCEEAWRFFKGFQSFSEKKEVCECLFEGYKSNGNAQKAISFLQKSILFGDSLRNENAVREIYVTQKNRAIERQKNEFKTTQLKKELKASRELEKQQLITGVTGIAAIIILLFFLFYYRISNERKKAAELLAREKQYLDNLLHNLVHEFRTPLTLIKGPAEELLKEDKDNSLFQMINRNSDHMLGLVNEVLDFAKIKSGKWIVSNEDTNLGLFLSDTIDLFAQHAEQKNIRLLKSWNGLLPVVKTDSDKLFKIISNLLSNAIKYSDPATEIRVFCEIIGHQLQLTIEDQGIGMTEEDQKKVFKKFYQVDATTTRKGEGTGIGLAFTKELVQLLGGKIELKSVLEKGTTIRVIIPIETVAETEVLTAVHPVSEPFRNVEHIETEVETAERPKILIIEDNVDLRAFLAQILAKSGHELFTAENGQKGIDLALELVPDLIISDIMMPEKDGYQVVEELKSNAATDHIPILLLTAKVSFDSRITGLNAGADDYLSKPFNAHELLLRVNNQLDRQEKLRQKYRSDSGSDALAAPKHPLLVKIEALMSIDFSGQFSAEELAAKCGLSRSQLHRKIKSLTGLSATGLMTKIRLEHAMTDLRKPDLTISEVSYKYGYGDPANFSRIFKKQFGKTPTEAREAAN